jgi:FAD-dependent urate hydroxylase
MRQTACGVVIVGAGPYGLGAAAALKKRGIEPHVFGDPMSFWQSMPVGMLLRSPLPACNIGEEPEHLLSVYAAEAGFELVRPLPLDRFIEYGRWVQQQVVPDVDRREVVSVARENGGFRVSTADGDSVTAHRVVVAAGIAPFAWRPPLFRKLPSEVVSHAADEHELDRFAGKRVVVVGAGQSALEGAALLHESGADVEVVARAPLIHWLSFRLQHKLGPITKLLYASPDVGPAGVSQFVAHPNWFRRLPRRWQDRLGPRSIRPAGAGWLKPRMVDVVPITLGRQVVDVSANGHVELTLDDGSKREADHVLLGTGYRIDIGGYGFLSPQLLQQIRTVGGYPVLGRGLESSSPGLHFVGAPAAWSFGPLMRFVAGSGFAARQLAREVSRACRP